MNQLKEEQRKLLEVQSDLKEKNVMQRLKYTEAMQNIADLKQYIAQLESKVELKKCFFISLRTHF